MVTAHLRSLLGRFSNSQLSHGKIVPGGGKKFQRPTLLRHPHPDYKIRVFKTLDLAHQTSVPFLAFIDKHFFVTLDNVPSQDSRHSVQDQSFPDSRLGRVDTTFLSHDVKVGNNAMSPLSTLAYPNVDSSLRFQGGNSAVSPSLLFTSPVAFYSPPTPHTFVSLHNQVYTVGLTNILGERLGVPMSLNISLWRSL